MQCENTDTRDCILQDSNYMKCSKGQFIGAGLVVVWSSGLEQGLTVNEYRGPCYSDKRVLTLIWGDDYTTQ